MSTQTIKRTVTIVSLSCGSCGIVFGLEKQFRDGRLESGAQFYCPNGCHISWAETELDRQKERADRLERLAKDQRFLREAEERSHAATRGHLTRQRRRAANGVCPCCQRTFANVAAHVKSQHPRLQESRLVTHG